MKKLICFCLCLLPCFLPAEDVVQQINDLAVEIDRLQAEEKVLTDFMALTQNDDIIFLKKNGLVVPAKKSEVSEVIFLLLAMGVLQTDTVAPFINESVAFTKAYKAALPAQLEKAKEGIATKSSKKKGLSELITTPVWVLADIRLDPDGVADSFDPSRRADTGLRLIDKYTVELQYKHENKMATFMFAFSPPPFVIRQNEPFDVLVNGNMTGSVEKGTQVRGFISVYNTTATIAYKGEAGDTELWVGQDKEGKAKTSNVGIYTVSPPPTNGSGQFYLYAQVGLWGTPRIVSYKYFLQHLNPAKS